MLAAAAGYGIGTLLMSTVPHQDANSEESEIPVLDQGKNGLKGQPEDSSSGIRDGQVTGGTSEKADSVRRTDIRVNFILFIIDDLGWTDTGSYGSTFYETPNIDQLAAEGARFTQFYTASPVCSPTRASIMTGKHPARINFTDYTGGKQKGQLLPAESIRQLPIGEVTIGDTFKAAGYTTGYIGKWHLGGAEFLPNAQGFDYMRAVNHSGAPGSYFYPYKNNAYPLRNVPDLKIGTAGEYLTDRLTEEALRFIQPHRHEHFLLVLSHYAVHVPLQSKQALTHKYTVKAAGLPPLGGPPALPEGTLGITKQRQDYPVYAGMVESVDQSVGRVLNKLRKLGLDSQTVVVFVSDNGGLSTFQTGRRGTPPTSVLPLRAGKGWLYEGGIRIPLIIKWPGVVPRGTEIEVPSITMDLYPTMLQIAGLPLRPKQHRDALSLVPLLRKTGQIPRQTLHWHYPHYSPTDVRPSGAIRVGNYKLIEWFEDNHLELYDLVQDVSESTNLAQQMPSKAAELRNLLHVWRSRVHARMPRPNWPF